jgi:hypothetical protein
MKKWVIRILGGWTDAESFIDSLPEESRHIVLTRAVEKLFNTVSKEDILQRTDTGLQFEGKPLQQAQINMLKEEAQSFHKSFLYRVLDKDVKYHGNKKMDEAQSLFQLESAKLLKYLWDIQKSRVIALEQTPEAKRSGDGVPAGRIITS